MRPRPPRDDGLLRGRVRAGRHLALGGILGPAGFVVAWAVGSGVADRYSPFDDPISRLAVTGAATRPLMTAGFVTFGLAVPLHGVALVRAGLAGAGAAAVVAGLATCGVAAFPLGVRTGTLHGALAIVAYAAVSAAPGLAAPRLAAAGAGRAAWLSAMACVVATLTLAATAVAGAGTGLLQRVGLTIADLWLAASAVWLLRHR